MPIHFEDLDVVPQIEGVRSALIVPCNMCPAVTIAVRENKPFMQLLKSFLKSPPFEEYLESLQVRLMENGIRAKIFRSRFYHHWFMCMWPEGQQRRLHKIVKKFDVVIVLGCESATVTVRDAVRATGCRVIEGMQVAGIMNARIKISPLGNISFADHMTIPLSGKINHDCIKTSNGSLDPSSHVCPPGAVAGCLH